MRPRLQIRYGALQDFHVVLDHAEQHVALPAESPSDALAARPPRGSATLVVVVNCEAFAGWALLDAADPTTTALGPKQRVVLVPGEVVVSLELHRSDAILAVLLV